MPLIINSCLDIYWLPRFQHNDIFLMDMRDCHYLYSTSLNWETSDVSMNKYYTDCWQCYNKVMMYDKAEACPEYDDGNDEIHFFNRNR